MAEREERYYYASQFTLMWWKFKKHRLALAAVAILALFYLVAICAEFIAPYTPTTDSQYLFVPPSKVHFSAAGEGLQRPFVYGLERTRDRETLRWVYHEDQQQKHVHPPVFCAGSTTSCGTCTAPTSTCSAPRTARSSSSAPIASAGICSRG